MPKRILAVAIGLLGAAALAGAQATQTAVDPAKVEAVFSRWTTSTPGCAVGVGSRRQERAGEGLRDGGSRARRPQQGGHDLRSRLGVEAVHGGGDSASGRRWQAVHRRPGAQVHSGAAGFRHAADDSAHAESHAAACATGGASPASQDGREARVCTRTRTWSRF